MPRSAMAGIGCAILSLGLVTNAFESALYACPAPCHGVPEDWNVYTSADRLQACREPMLLDFALDPAVNLTERVTKLFTCSSKIENANTRVLASSSERQARGPHGVPNEWSHSQSGSPTCFSSQERTLSLDFFMDSTPGSATSNDLQTILDHAQHYLTDVLHCDTTNLFGYYNGATIGIFSGSSIDNARMISSVIWGLHGRISKDQSAKTITLQRCNDLPNADYVFGLAIDMDGDLAAVQKAVTSWSSAECAVTSQASTKLHDVVFHEKTLVPALNRTSTVHKNEHLSKRGDCRTITVVSGDSCSSLASKCGIPANDFNEYNPKENLCSTLTPGQPICCSAGGLPDIRPEPNADGSCASYKVQSGDTCSAIAVSHGLRTSELSEFNDGTTWGWFGCDDLQLGLKICLSTGGPPMPTPVTNAQCGPTVPGTEMPANGTNLLDLNQCPLNACCDIWGQCGITPEYCTNVTGPLGNPGTAPRGQNGCISNCGTNITNDIFPPTNFMKIGYYESWNWERPCLNLRASSVSVVEYSHVHWAFATITDDFDVAINDTYDQWQGFLKLYGVHKVISIGGWDFSTSISTYDKLRRAMEPANVDAFVDKIFNFVEKNGLNGIDVDWEYPGARDIPGVPPGLESDGPNYLSFLKKMRRRLPHTKTISIAAPASYWYLKAFPIKEMATQLDYIVYMTYDLHGKYPQARPGQVHFTDAQTLTVPCRLGQWDYGRRWSQEGCPAGDCLRSHVNLTETEYSLAMISKAGVDTNMVVVGVPSYARSFGMAEENCTGPNCRFTGTRKHSTATPGRCTQTAGIITNAEIMEVLGLEAQETIYYDPGSDSNVVVYNGTWAAFMDSETMMSRTNYYRSLNFAGTVQWAVDLKEFSGDDGNPTGAWEEPIPPELPACTETFDSVEALGDAHGMIPDHCVTPYTVRTLADLLTAAMNNYTEMINHGYDQKFKIYATAVAGKAGSSVHDFVYKNGNKYFTCEVAEVATCCDYCKSQPSSDDTCRYCWTDGECYKRCTGLECTTTNVEQPVSKVFNKSEPCPPDYSERGSKLYHEETVYWSLNDDKANQFYADIFSDTGIGKGHLKFGDYDRGNDCTPANTIGDGDPCWTLEYDFNIPVPDGYDASDVADPKDTVQKGLERSANLSPQISQVLFGLATDTWIGDGMDLIDSISMPILMVAQAVEEMSKVVDIADQITEAKEEMIIAAFIGALLFMIPVAGEILGTVAGFAEVGAVLVMAGEAANIAMGVAEVVKDPDNAPLAIMNLIFVPGALADAARIAKAARLRRDMRSEDITKLGGRVSSRLDSIKKVTGRCVP